MYICLNTQTPGNVSSVNAIIHTPSHAWNENHMKYSVLCVFNFRYGMTSLVHDDKLWLLGGVGLQSSPEMIVANLIHRVWFWIRLKVCHD